MRGMHAHTKQNIVFTTKRLAITITAVTRSAAPNRSCAILAVKYQERASIWVKREFPYGQKRDYMKSKESFHSGERGIFHIPCS